MLMLPCRRAITALFALAVSSVHAQPAPGSITVTPIVTTGLSGPVGVMNAGDGSDRLFVIQQGGAVRVVRNDALLATPYLTLTNGATQCAETPGGTLFNTGLVSGGFEQGLLGLAFHPAFETNGQFFLSFSGANGDTIVARVTASDPAADVLAAGDGTSCVVVLRVDQDFSNHNGGNIAFGPDGYLYFGLGDGGSGNDPCNRAQTLNPANLINTGGSCPSDPLFTDPGGGQPQRSAITRALLGKMLRLDVDGSTPAGSNGLCGARLDGGANYAIPADNPFAGADAQSACDEVWSYGWRNPWRWSFDRVTRDFIVGDVGQDQWEEVDFFASADGRGRGANADWNICEGRHLRNSCSILCSAAQTSEVIVAYHNTSGCPSPTAITGSAVTGGYRYRGNSPELQGVYFFGDSGRPDIYYTVQAGGGWTTPNAGSTIASGAGGAVVAFGEDEDSNVYVIGGSRLSRIGPSGPAEVLFADGLE